MQATDTCLSEEGFFQIYSYTSKDESYDLLINLNQLIHESREMPIDLVEKSIHSKSNTNNCLTENQIQRPQLARTGPWERGEREKRKGRFVVTISGRMEKTKQASAYASLLHLIRFGQWLGSQGPLP